MKKIKSENGAITILVVVSILFMVSFLISSYTIIANKVQAQKEIIAETKRIYENNFSMDEIYNSYFNYGDNMIPIYNTEQLLMIGINKDMNINGEYYNFNNDEDTIYMLMNDIEFNAYEQESLYKDGSYYWEPIGQRTDLLSTFEGNGHKIKVNYKDGDNDIYTIEYSNKKNYSEPEYEVSIKARILDENGEIDNNAIIYVNNEPQEQKGEIKIPVKRLTKTEVYATSDIYKNSDTETILIENPNKIQNYDLVLGKYEFTIVPTPADATVKINNENVKTIMVNKGEKVTWSVEADGYISQSGAETINEDLKKTVTLVKKETYNFTITPIPSNANVLITSDGKTLKNGTGSQTVNVVTGTSVSWTVSGTYYQTKSGTETITSNNSKTVSLTQNTVKTISLTPYSVSSEFNESENGKEGVDSTNFAYSMKTSPYTWNFNGESINSNAKITDIQVSCRLGTTVAGTKADLKLIAGSKTYLSQTTENLNITLDGQIYEYSISSLPSASEIKSSLKLNATKNGTTLSYLRCYGAMITIKYIEP